MAVALLLSPPASREWVEAMTAELDYADGSFQALSWSIGCLATALKQLSISLLAPRALAWGTEGTMNRVAKVMAVALTAGSALFLFAPTFQQGLKVTAESWRQSNASWLATMKSLGVKAEAARDAQTLAFVALQLGYDTRDHVLRDKFANEAVAADQDLTWIYAPLLSTGRMASPEHPDPNQARWLSRLQAWDPNNAVVYSLAASFDRPPGALGWKSTADRAQLANSPRWLADMARAFSAANYDSYLQRKTDLERNVVHRQGLDDPGPALLGLMQYPLPDLIDYRLYAKYFLMKAGAESQSQGDLSHAEEAYGKIVHMAQLFQLHGSTDLESLFGIGLEQSAGPQLEAVLRKSGNPTAANLVALQTALGKAAASRIRVRNSSVPWEADFHRLDAYLVQLSLLGIAFSLLVIVFCCASLAGGRILQASGTARLRSFFAGTGLAATLLLFVSVVGMYLGYSSYAAAFQNYLAATNPREVYQSLGLFMTLEELPSNLFYSFQHIYLWYAVIAVGCAVLAWIFYRHLARMLHRSAPVRPAL